MLFALKELHPFAWRQIVSENAWLRNHTKVCEKLWARFGFKGVGGLL